VVIFVRMHQPTSKSGLIARLTGRALMNPRVALDLLTLAWAFRRRNWWRRAPFVPLPDAAYLEWRLHTAYGDELTLPPVEDVVRFAQWRRRILSD
jgi:hypothetical protein